LSKLLNFEFNSAIEPIGQRYLHQNLGIKNAAATIKTAADTDTAVQAYPSFSKNLTNDEPKKVRKYMLKNKNKII
jgi:hypothetical protein